MKKKPKKKPPRLSLVKQSDDDLKEESKAIRGMIARLSYEKLQRLLVWLEQLALKVKAASPLRRKARQNKIHPERAGKIRRIK